MLLSHTKDSINVSEKINKIVSRINEEGDKPHASISYQLALLEELHQFELGKFLINNGGLNGYWTHYVVTYSLGSKASNVCTESPLEAFLLQKSPSLLATQERFKTFLSENQKALKPNAALACIPCGMMGELLHLDYTQVNTCKLFGLDFDSLAIQAAKSLAEEKQLADYCHFKEADAWALGIQQEFDLVSSNGLNIYEPDDEKVIQLYHNFYDALKPGGKLVTSFLTHPPTDENICEWDMSKINRHDLQLQQIILADIIKAKWQCFRSSAKTEEQLKKVGFKHIRFIYDNARMFPTVVAFRE